MTHKALNLLSLSRKGGNIELGEESVGACCRANHARLLILASDAGDNVRRRASSFTAHYNTPLVTAPFTKEELGMALGRSVCAIACLSDVQLAQAFVKALDSPEQYAELLAALETRVARVKQRRQEERAHRNNVKHGKK